MKNYGKGTRTTTDSGKSKGNHYRDTGQAKYTGGGMSSKDGYKPTKLPKK